MRVGVSHSALRIRSCRSASHPLQKFRLAHYLAMTPGAHPAAKSAVRTPGAMAGIAKARSASGYFEACARSTRLILPIGVITSPGRMSAAQGPSHLPSISLVLSALPNNGGSKCVAAAW